MKYNNFNILKNEKNMALKNYSVNFVNFKLLAGTRSPVNGSYMYVNKKHYDVGCKCFPDYFDDQCTGFSIWQLLYLNLMLA